MPTLKTSSLKPDQPPKPKPTIHLDSVDLPDIGEMNLDDKVTLQVSGTVKSLSKDFEDKKKSNATIEISKIRKIKSAITDRDVETKDKEEIESDMEKEVMEEE